MSGILYIVATPIGNLGDLSPRAGDTLRAVDYILAEDTRVTLRILQHTGIAKPLISYSEHSSEKKDDVIIANLLAGKNYALVSDAGTPALSDPGARIVGLARENCIAVVPIPGPSAVTTIAGIFGVPFTALHFWGFFPQKSGKQTALIRLMQSVPGLHVFFESPFRILKTFEKHLLGLEEFTTLVGREMTKRFESYHFGAPAEVLAALRTEPVKGEFCVALTREKRYAPLIHPARSSTRRCY